MLLLLLLRCIHDRGYTRVRLIVLAALIPSCVAARCRVFGIRLVPQQLGKHEGWAPGVRKSAATHETEGLVGTLYLDLAHRPHKHTNAATFMIRCGRRLTGNTYQLPIVALLCNFPGTSLTLQEFEVLCHEFGHVMHALLSRTEFQHVSGTRGPPDFTEIPSHLFEHYATNYDFLQTFARHR